MLTVPTNQKELVKFTNDLVETCRISVSNRQAYCRLMNAIAETGRIDGTKSLLNLLYAHLSRLASHLFSPVELKFSVDYERDYPDIEYKRAAVVAKVLTRQWERQNIDLLFGQGVFESLKYGACLMKQWAQEERGKPGYYAKLVMPWQFGVYNESETEIAKQPALCETVYLTKPEIWRRIYHLPDAEKLFRRIMTHAQNGTIMSEPQSYFHQVLSTSQLNTGVQGMTRPLPGGIVQLNNDPNYAIMGPQIGAKVVTAHELWVQDDDDYTTIFMIEPDIIVSPLHKKANLLVKDSHLQPYTVIRVNEVTNWFWGRSELVDLIEPQGLLSTTLDDSRRMVGLQVDKILGFSGDNGITQERYDQFRAAGWMDMGPNSKIEDVTPKFPPELMPYITFLIEQIHLLGGFPPIMQGTGDSGVRAGTHANTLLKTGSPTLRDRALLAERLCATAADLTLAIREAKDESRFWVKGDTIQDAENSSFLLADLHDDWRVTIDSHSSSPIFADENTQLVVAAHKMGVVDAEYVIDNTQLPNKEAAKVGYRKRAESQQLLMKQLMQQDPQAAEKVLTKQLGGGKR